MVMCGRFYVFKGVSWCSKGGREPLLKLKILIRALKIKLYDICVRVSI